MAEESMIGRICSGCVLMIVGIFLFPASLGLLGWNENNFVCTNNKILYAGDKAREVDCKTAISDDDTPIFYSCKVLEETMLQNASMRLFYPNGGFTSQAVLPATVAASATAEWYICKEKCETKTKKNAMGQNVDYTDCSYTAGWSIDPRFDPTSFNPSFRTAAQSACQKLWFTEPYKSNPGISPGTTAAQYRTPITAGVYQVNVPEWLGRLGPSAGGASRIFPGSNLDKGSWNTANAVYTLSRNAYDEPCSPPTWGCMRITLHSSPVIYVSMFTRTTGTPGRTGPIQIPGSWGCGKSNWQDLLADKFYANKEDFGKVLQDVNQSSTWLLRLVGLLLAWGSIFLCLQPLAAGAGVMGQFANMCPCGGYVQDLIEGVVGFIICVISCSVGCSCGLFVIALVWVAMRPVVGIPLMLVSLFLIGLAAAAGKHGQQNKSARDLEAATNYELPAVPVVAATPMAVPILAQPSPQTMQVTCPAGCAGGSVVQITAPDGRLLQVTVPAGIGPGQAFTVQI